MDLTVQRIPSDSDETLCAQAAVGDRLAEETLVLRYQRMTRSCARPYFLAGGDSEDLFQEAMLGLLNAIREYDPQRDASFRAFAETCIRNRVRSAVTAAARGKHIPLNHSVPFEALMLGCEHSPEELFISREAERERLTKLRRCLSPLERQILELYLQGFSYREIGSQVERSAKSVDNAVQRIRRKVLVHYGDFSES